MRARVQRTFWLSEDAMSRVAFGTSSLLNYPCQWHSVQFLCVCSMSRLCAFFISPLSCTLRWFRLRFRRRKSTAVIVVVHRYIHITYTYYSTMLLYTQVLLRTRPPRGRRNVLAHKYRKPTGNRSATGAHTRHLFWYVHLGITRIGKPVLARNQAQHITHTYTYINTHTTTTTPAPAFIVMFWRVRTSFDRTKLMFAAAFDCLREKPQLGCWDANARAFM